MNIREMVPNKKYRNVVVEGCKFAWVRLVQKHIKNGLVKTQDNTQKE